MPDQTSASTSPIPITLARGDIVPTKYLILETVHCCRNCDNKSLTYQTFAVCHIRTQQAHGRRYVEHMIPIDTFTYNVRQEWRKGKVEFTACCDECAPWSCLDGYQQLDLSHLPIPVTQTPSVILAAYQQPAEPTSSPKKPSKPRVDPLDLI